MKKIIYFLLLIVLLSGGVFLAEKRLSMTNQTNDPARKHVVTTLFPLYDFVKNIGQDKVQVRLLLPPGVEPHAFEPNPNDIVSINQADIFVYTGDFMESWASDVLAGVTNKTLNIVDASSGTRFISSVFRDQDEDYDANDPHIWLDFDNAQIMVDNIAKGLVQVDFENKDFYLANADSFKHELKMLDINYKETLAACKKNEIVYGGHYAFGYLAKRYGLHYLPAVKGFEPSSEPTANDLVELASQVKQNGVSYIFYEELSSPKVAQTIAKETGAKLLLLNAAHNVGKDDLQNGVSYVSVMEANLANLKIGLECQ
jgi:zinc transport system substrate-binding protein